MKIKTYLLIFLWGFACYGMGTIHDEAHTGGWWYWMILSVFPGVWLCMHLEKLNIDGRD